jgi:hypothetical protein
MELGTAGVVSASDWALRLLNCRAACVCEPSAYLHLAIQQWSDGLHYHGGRAHIKDFSGQ